MVELERRNATRIDKVFRIQVSTEDWGDQWYVARNISASGMFVEMAEPLPLRTKVIVRFQLPGDDSAICAIARVQQHYYLNYVQTPLDTVLEALEGGVQALCGVGLRFLRFVPEIGAPTPRERLH